MKISDTVYQVDDVVGAPTLIVDADYLSLVDTGIPGSEGKIFALIESLGRKRADLKNILITHSDLDHIGSLPALLAATGAQVYAQREEAQVIEGARKTRNGQLVPQRVRVARLVHDGEVLPLHGGIQVVETFGHAIGHVSYYLLKEKLLIVGDCLVNTEGLGNSRPQYTFNAEQANATVKKLAALGPASLCFGHGTPIVGDASPQLQALAESI